MQLGETHIVTVDGTYGSKGFVTDVIGKESVDLSTLLQLADRCRC